jgi:glycosyltransferase involved in cell wall biosynthesis
MLVGRPVVASDVGGIKDQIGRFGAVVAPRDSVALASAVERVLGNYERYAAIASDESAKAMRRFSVAAMVDAHEALYERVQRSPARRHAARYAAGSWASTRALCWVSTCRGHVPS